MLANDWAQALDSEFRKPYYKNLYMFVKEEYSKRVVYPPADDIFNAFHFTPLHKVKVLLLGPCHNGKAGSHVRLGTRLYQKGRAQMDKQATHPIPQGRVRIFCRHTERKRRIDRTSRSDE